MIDKYIEMKLDEADRIAEESNVRYSCEDLFRRARERLATSELSNNQNSTTEGC